MSSPGADPTLAQALRSAPLRVLGRLTEASNLALLCEVHVGRETRRCVYKAASGERALWDFPGAVLARREVLTAQAAHCFGWDLVPTTVWRDDGPAGPGMCQEWVDSTGEDPVALFGPESVPDRWVVVASGQDAHGAAVVLAHQEDPDLRRLVVLDALVNNADRKGGHVLRRTDGRLVGIDHGVTFHSEPKLRTVLWGWGGQPVDPWLLDEVTRGAADFRRWLEEESGELSADEVGAAQQRLVELLDSALFPVPSGNWPALPWPPL